MSKAPGLIAGKQPSKRKLAAQSVAIDSKKALPQVIAMWRDIGTLTLSIIVPFESHTDGPVFHLTRFAIWGEASYALERTRGLTPRYMLA